MFQNRITTLLQQDKKLLIAYSMPEFPIVGATLPVLEALEESGADIVELGMPYSDPIGDGPVIQDAAHTAIRNGVTIKSLLELVRRARQGEGCKRINVPILLMGYCNVHQNSPARRAHASGVEAVAMCCKSAVPTTAPSAKAHIDSTRDLSLMPNPTTNFLRVC